MLITEWNWDDAKEVWQEEAREVEKLEVARKMKKAGYPIVQIKEITGLSAEAIEHIE